MRDRYVLALLTSLAMLTWVSGCDSAPVGTDTGPPPAVDAGSMMAPLGVLELGTGAEGFEPVSEGDTLGLARGLQGLQHVWISLRMRDVDPELAITEVTLTRRSDGVMVNEPFRVRLAYEPSAEWSELVGVRLVTPDEAAVFEQSLLLRARVEGRDGAWAEAEAQVYVVPENQL